MSEVMNWGIGIITSLGVTGIIIILTAILVIKKVKKIVNPIMIHNIKKKNKKQDERIAALELKLYTSQNEAEKWRDKALKIHKAESKHNEYSEQKTIKARVR